MPAVFIPPMIEDTPWVNAETPPLARRLFRYYGAIPRGRTVVLIDGVYTTVDNPDQLLLEGLEEGVDYFLGGHEYIISDAVATDLTGDGYGGGIGEIQLPDTWGSFSTTQWGALDNDFWAGV